MLRGAAALACTPAQLLYLLALRDGRPVFGVNDLLHGKPEAELIEAFELARAQLVEQGILTFDDANQSVSIDFVVARLIDAVARPRRAVLALRVAEAVEQRCFFVRGSVVVELLRREDRKSVV